MPVSPEAPATAPTTGQTPTTPQPPAAPQAPAQAAPASSAPTTGSIPQRTQLRPQSAPGGIPTTSAPQSAPAAPAPATPAPAAAPREEHSPLQGALGTGTAKLKDLAGRAAESFKAGDDLATPSSKGGPRKARVLLSRVDPWSALKLGFLMSIALGIMLVVAVFVIWNVLNGMGFFALVNEWVLQLFTPENEINIMQFFDRNKVMSAAILVSVVNVVLITALTTIGAFLYNVVSSVVGGVYVTLTDD
ncbi:hypothetical protein GCM10025873_21850 [Demequina sediminis]|nr:DUF3566 domain-containing protein [Demequina sediminis]BDZ62394.1 hypothetical protein GCM10025873_21850 [Demequina sediminis]